jgi:hypothetical protein
MSLQDLRQDPRIAHRWLAACVALVLFAATTVGGAQSSKHSIKVSFNYDFGLTPACTPGLNHDCVKQFILYDISDGVSKRRELMTIPVPPNPHGFVKGITATTPRRDFKTGKLSLAVVAQMPNGQESTPCTASVKVP